MPGELDDLTPEERSKLLLSKIRRTVPQVAEEPKAASPAATNGHYDADLIPEVDYEKSADDQRMDAVLDNIDIIDAYVALIGKMQPEVRGNRTEGIMISCPMPGHADNNPSAWINTNKQTWFCGGCQTGGDIYDLAAIHFGYDLSGYKSKESFPLLRKQLAEKFGFRITTGISGDEYVVKVQDEPEQEEIPDEPSPEQPPSSPPVEVEQQAPPVEEPTATVTPLKLVPPHPSATLKGTSKNDESRSALFIEWDKIFPEDTFGRAWMEATTIDDLPHEFYFWLAIQALGFAGGHNNVLQDFQEVKPNFYVCLYGRTGLGKSRSMRPYLQLIEDVFPFTGDKYTDPEGVRILPTPGSGEAVIDSFKWDVLDSSTQQYDHSASVTGLVRHEELSSLIAKAARQGSSIKEVMIEMYDVHNGDVTVVTRTSGVTRAHNPFCQMISTTQPNAIHAFLRKADIESGFINRWVMAAGVPRVRPIPYGFAYQDITVPAQKLRDVWAWSRPGHKFILAGDAFDAWAAFFNRELAPIKSGEVAQESIYSRVDLTLKKLIICLTLNEKLDQPTGEIVEKVVSLYPYMQVSYSMFAKDMTFSDVTDCQNRIVQIIEHTIAKGGTPPSKRDITRALARKFDGETVVRSLKNLLDLGLLDETATIQGARGRPTVRYLLPSENN